LIGADELGIGQDFMARSIWVISPTLKVFGNGLQNEPNFEHGGPEEPPHIGLVAQSPHARQDQDFIDLIHS
jgi:hypothetical protein